jgi:hypothetical protein
VTNQTFDCSFVLMTRLLPAPSGAP